MNQAVTWADHQLICSDGVELVARIWQPVDIERAPVLLMRQPYGRAIASTPTYAHPSWYAAHGFVVVVQDVRGTGDSQGTFAGFAQEAQDSAETVLWARALPMGNGRVGTYGFSYQGLTQLLNQDPLGRPEALPDALAPAMCGLDEQNHWSCSGGAHWWALGLAWGLQLAALQCRRRGDHDGWRQIRSSLASQAFLADGLGLLEALDPNNMVLGWLRCDPRQSDAWTTHQVDPRLLERPMLLIGGWSDPHLAGVLDLDARSRACGRLPWLRIGAWSHLHWRGGLDAVQLAFFRRYLAGATDAQPAARLLQCQRSLQWFDGTDPSGFDTPELRWGLRSTGLAAIDAQEGQLLPGGVGGGALTLVHDPWRPAPAAAGHLAPAPAGNLRDSIDARSDVACFQTAELVEAMPLQGTPVLRLDACADQPGFDIVATLSVIGPSGAAQQLTMGVARFLGETCLQPALREVELQPLFTTLNPGERLRLSVAASAWPLIAVNPGDGSQPCGEAGPEHRVISLDMQLDQAELHLKALPIGSNRAN